MDMLTLGMNNRTMRIAAVIEAIVCMLVDYLRFSCSRPVPGAIAPGIFVGLALLMPYPAAHDNAVFCQRCCMASAICLAVVTCLPLSPVLMVLAISVVMTSFQVYAIFVRFSNEKSLICNMTIWHNIEDCERLVLALAYLLLALVYVVCQDSCPAVQWSVLGVAASAFVLRYYQVNNNIYLFFGKERQQRIRNQLQGRIQPASPIRNDEEMARLNALYGRVQKIMEEKQPYLDPGLKLPELAAMLFTNKVYLSRTINVMSGLNFSQFVNAYRVKYSKELMKKDPRLQVQEVATLAGFQTTASLNMAFKLFEGVTPGQYGRTFTEDPSNQEDMEP